MKNMTYCIIHTDSYGTRYLAWQNPVWYESGYFWTSKNTFKECIPNSTNEHPFLFNTTKEAVTFLKSFNIPQKCRVVKWKALDLSSIKNNNTDNKYSYPGIAIEVSL